MNNENTSTTNAILVILLVIVVGFVVWFATMRNDRVDTVNEGDTSPSLEVNLDGGSSGTDTTNQ